MCVCVHVHDLKLQRTGISLAAEATGDTNLFHGTPHRLILVRMVPSRSKWLPLLQVIRSRICGVVQVFLATGTGQELPPVSFELGATRQGGAFRRCGSTRRVVMVMVGQSSRNATRSTRGYRRNGRQFRGLLRYGAWFERVVQFAERSRRGLIQRGAT